jgi:hypothetical protein
VGLTSKNIKADTIEASYLLAQRIVKAKSPYNFYVTVNLTSFTLILI